MKKLKASLTIEASLILPFIIAVILTVSYLIEYVRIQTIISGSMYNIADEISSYAYPYRNLAETENNNLVKSATDIISISKINSVINDGIDMTDVNKNLIDGHINTDSCSIIDKLGNTKIVANYKLKIPFGLLKIPSIKCHKEVLSHGWLGYIEDTNEDDEYVYITKNGTVYHRNPGCSYIKINPKQVVGNKIKDLRNNGGAKYYPCENCMKSGIISFGLYYITDDGNRIHSTKDCSKIKREIIKVKLSEVGGRGPCSKCGK